MGVGNGRRIADEGLLPNGRFGAGNGRLEMRVVHRAISRMGLLDYYRNGDEMPIEDRLKAGLQRRGKPILGSLFVGVPPLGGLFGIASQPLLGAANRELINDYAHPP